MKKVNLEYNPFLLETRITIDGKPVSDSGALHRWRKGRRMQEWVDNLFPELVAECRGDIELGFNGTKLDYEDVTIALEKYEQRMKSSGEKCVEIELKRPQKFAKDAKIRLAELKELFADMQRNCPFPDLKDEKIQQKFRDAIDTEFDVAVIATMSSGKSTLINAFLGRSLMPSKNAACTATITHIKDVDNKETFSAVCFDKDRHAVAEDDDLTLEAMKRYNSDERVVNIAVEGDIPFVRSEEMQLVLLDTPGPNNSRTLEHRERTYSIVKDDTNMPMVLYVMAKDNVEDTSVHELLGVFANHMKKQHGKQARDRFIFVINQLDDVDTTDEPIEDFIQKARELLKEYEIEDANIYPVSAEIAKLIRMDQRKDDLTEFQREKLNSKIRYFSRTENQLEKYGPSQTIRDEMQERLDNTQNEIEKILVYTGVPSLEAAIAKYVERYAITDKIHTAFNAFNRQIQEKHLMAQLQERLSQDEAERKRINEQMGKLSKQLDDGGEAKKFKDKINGIHFESDLREIVRNLRVKFLGSLKSERIQRGKEVTPKEAKKLANDLAKKVPLLGADLKTDLQDMIKTCVIHNANRILDEYRDHIQSLLTEINLPEYAFDSTMEILTVNLPDVDDLVEKYTEIRTQRVKVGEEEVEDDTWWNFPLNPLMWIFGKDTHKEDIFEDQKYEVVDGEQVLKDIVDPVWKLFNTNIDNAEDHAKKQAKEFKDKFIEQLEILESILKEKTKELESMTSNKNYLDEQIKENNANKKWLMDFQKQLDGIINIG